ncbi:MAG TPA: Uma2 family endonuclease [Bryobacteraceae bacterium]|nr:Uma2 family endonuclease [Bryobacteraceae bacterium]
MQADAVQYLTPEEYLVVERAAGFRGEYHDGARFPKQSGTWDHGRIVGAAAAELYCQRGDRDFYIAMYDLRVAIPRYNAFVYPDVVATCGRVDCLDECSDTLTDATFIIEVLSPLTKNYDRGDKFRFYRSLPSFSEYLILAQDEVRAEHYRRQPDGSWQLREFVSRSDEVELTSIGCRLRLDDVYTGVEFGRA